MRSILFILFISSFTFFACGDDDTLPTPDSGSDAVNLGSDSDVSGGDAVVDYGDCKLSIGVYEIKRTIIERNCPFVPKYWVGVVRDGQYIISSESKLRNCGENEIIEILKRGVFRF